MRAPAIAIIPVKRFERAKSRLRTRLHDAERASLARGMFEHVLASLQACDGLSHVLVATDGPDVAALAAARGAEVWPDPEPTPPLSQVVDLALGRACTLGAEFALVLMADLPHLQASDVEALLAASERDRVVLSADLRGRCTNALGIPLRRGFRTAFGDPNSLQLHELRARALDLHPVRVDRPGLAHDVDLPADLAAVASWGQG
jgi:2-phospho-L-lactate guanylyltransferase